MPWSIKADPLAPESALKALRAKAPALVDLWDDVDTLLDEQAFTLSGVAQLDLVADVLRALDETLASGGTLDDFKDVVEEQLTDAWAGTVKNPAWRIETIFRTNAQTAFMAGRMAAMTDPDIISDHPYWLFDAIDDDRECDICEPCDGTVRPADDPWWTQHTPPLHHNCRCGITSLSHEQAARMGIAPHGPPARAADGFGALPTLAAWAPSASDYPQDLWRAYQDKNADDE